MYCNKSYVKMVVSAYFWKFPVKYFWAAVDFKQVKPENKTEVKKRSLY